MRNPATAHWRDSGRTPRFFFMDAYSAFPLLLFLLHIRLWTFALACGVCAFFVVLNRFGFSVPVFLRWARSFTAGNNRNSHLWITRRKNG